MAEQQNSLLNQLRGNKAVQSADALQPKMTDETGRIQGLLRAKSGRAVGPEAGPAASTLQEQVAAQQGREQAVNVLQQEEMGLEQLQQEELFRDQQAAQQEAQLDDRQVALQEQYVQRASALMQNFVNQGRELDFSQKKAQVEQVGFALRLNNEKYVADLQQAGAKARLTDALEFQEALQRSIFAEELDLLNSDLSFQRMLDKEAREFKMDVAELDINQAINIAMARSDAANTQAMYEAGATAVGTGLKYLGTMESKDGNEQTSTAAETGSKQPNTAVPAGE